MRAREARELRKRIAARVDAGEVTIRTANAPTILGMAVHLVYVACKKAWRVFWHFNAALR
jgi:hypothetical protein